MFKKNYRWTTDLALRKRQIPFKPGFVCFCSNKGRCICNYWKLAGLLRLHYGNLPAAGRNTTQMAGGCSGRLSVQDH